MKVKLLATLMIFPIICSSATTTFKCHSTDTLGINKFDAHGVVNIDDRNNVRGLISVNLQKAQVIESTQNFEDVHISGFIHHFKAGEVIDEAFDQLVLTTNVPYLKVLNLLVGFPNRATSKLKSIDNFLYRSSCKFID